MEEIAMTAPVSVVVQTQPMDAAAPEGHIWTNKGYLPIASLTKEEIVKDEPEVVSTATEYRLDGELVRRDVNLALKPKQILNLEAQEL